MSCYGKKQTPTFSVFKKKNTTKVYFSLTLFAYQKFPRGSALHYSHWVTWVTEVSSLCCHDWSIREKRTWFFPCHVAHISLTTHIT